MIETLTPAVCGSRRRQRLALAVFTLGAVGAALVTGALLGLAGSVLGAERAVLGVAILALAAAAREGGLLRLPLPQSRRQVPERWRAVLPLPVWSFGYGAGLGVGVATFQPVATFWVACAAAVALARPLPAALCFSLYGAGRALTVAWPRRRDDATAAVESLARRRGTLARANAVALTACAVLLAAAPAAGAAPVSLGAGLDPSVSRGVVARAVAGTSSVVVQPPDAPAVEIPAASAPSLDGDLLAYEDASGIRVINWRTGEHIDQVAGAVSKPALDWPLLAYRRLDSDYERIIVKDLATGDERSAARYSPSDDVGRPSLRGGHLAWHHANTARSRILLMPLATWQRVVVARTKIGLLAHAAVTSRRLVWVDQRSGRSYLRQRSLRRTSVKTLWTLKRRGRLFWTTALEGRAAFVTRWSPATGAAKLYRVDF